MAICRQRYGSFCKAGSLALAGKGRLASLAVGAALRSRRISFLSFQGGSVIRIIATLTIVLCLTPRAPFQRRVPTVDDLLNVKSVGGAQISPDGKWVAYTVTETDFKQDAFVTQIWLADVSTGRTLQLTRGEKSAASPRWSPDGKWLAFTSPRSATQSDLRDPPRRRRSGAADQGRDRRRGFAWSRRRQDASRSSRAEPPTQAPEGRKEQLGDFEVVRQRVPALAPLDARRRRGAARRRPPGTQRTQGQGRSPSAAFSWSPDGTRDRLQRHGQPRSRSRARRPTSTC